VYGFTGFFLGGRFEWIYSIARQSKPLKKEERRGHMHKLTGNH
jgi:hypothetical protein